MPAVICFWIEGRSSPWIHKPLLANLTRCIFLLYSGHRLCHYHRTQRSEAATTAGPACVQAWTVSPFHLVKPMEGDLHGMQCVGFWIPQHHCAPLYNCLRNKQKTQRFGKFARLSPHPCQLLQVCDASAILVVVLLQVFSNLQQHRLAVIIQVGCNSLRF